MTESKAEDVEVLPESRDAEKSEEPEDMPAEKQIEPENKPEKPAQNSEKPEEKPENIKTPVTASEAPRRRIKQIIIPNPKTGSVKQRYDKHNRRRFKPRDTARNLSEIILTTRCSMC